MSEEQKESKEQALVPRPRNPITMGSRGIVFSSFEEAWRVAGVIGDSQLGPKGMSQSAILVAIQMGAELGLPPMASLQNIAVINGRPSVWGDAIPAICMASGVFDFQIWEEAFEQDEKGEVVRAICRCARVGGHLVERSFSLADAKKAGLLGKTGPWKEYTPRMLQMRARSWALRDAFPDALRGFPIADRETRQMVDGPMIVEQENAPRRVDQLREQILSRIPQDPHSQEPPVYTSDFEDHDEPEEGAA